MKNDTVGPFSNWSVANSWNKPLDWGRLRRCRWSKCRPGRDSTSQDCRGWARPSRKCKSNSRSGLQYVQQTFINIFKKIYCPSVQCFTCPDADVTADISQHGLQRRFEDVGIEAHQFVVVQVDDLKVVACIKFRFHLDFIWHFIIHFCLMNLTG